MIKKKNALLLTVIIVVCVFAAVIVFVTIFKNKSSIENAENNSSKTTVSIYTNDEMTSMAAEILSDASLEQTSSVIEDEYTTAFSEYRLKHPYDTIEAGQSLTLQQIDENIADLQSEYLSYLKHCKSEYFKEWAKTKYNSYINELSLLRQMKTATPDDRKSALETAFYTTYQRKAEIFSAPEENGYTPEEAAKQMDIAERAKKYYESGEITIEQACQALMISGPFTTYDETFSLPE